MAVEPNENALKEQPSPCCNFPMASLAHFIAFSFAFKLALMAIWHNGTLNETASIDASSAGLLLGWGVFTTIGVKNGRPLWLDQHLARLRRDAARCDIPIPFSDDVLRDGLTAVLSANQINNGLARLTATRRDDGRWNINSATDITLLALESPSPKTNSLRVGFAPAPSQGELMGVKTTSYLPYIWSWRQAQKCGWDEVILLHNGLIVEAARSSIFWAKEGILQTSPLSLGALDGIGRSLTFEWAKTNGIEIQTVEAPARALNACEEVFLISAATGPRAIGTLCVSNHEISLPTTNPIFEGFRAWWDSQ
ncbi:D-alanine aminotransferase [Abditibacteriota bacterium]|nr:D-alanine aminotransferase [Abditibacteriota bacterium]